MKVKLNVLERVLLMNMLPQKGNLEMCRAINNTAKIIMITPEEEKEFELKKEGGLTSWNELGKEEREFPIPPSSVKAIRDILYKLDEKEELSANAVSLCEKFLPGEGKTEESPA